MSDRSAPIPEGNPASSDPQPWPIPRPVPINLPVEIGGYRIQRVLGSGGMATVYAALQLQPRRTVALKVMKAGIADVNPEAAVRRFRREIEILGKLHHPYIAQVYDAGMHAEPGSPAVPYFVMEYVSSASTILKHIAAKDLDLRARLALFVKVCAGVDHGHRNKVIHRDLKPGNILIDQYGEPKIIDFGIAQAAELDVSMQTMHTESVRLLGTLQYMSPEQVDATPQDLDSRCDVYALGALLYKILTNKPAHDLEGLPVYQAVRAVRERTPTRPSELRPEIRGDLETIILKAMEPDRSSRYRNAGSLGRDIVRYLSNKPIHARRASLVRRARLFGRRNRGPLTAAAIIALVMSIAAGIIFVQRWQFLREQQRAVQDRPLIEPSTVVAHTPQAEPHRAPPAIESSPLGFRLSEHTGRISGLAFSADGTTLLSASHDHRLIAWDVGNKALLWTAEPFEEPVTGFAMTADGSLVAVAADAQPVRLIDGQTGVMLQTIRQISGAIQAVAISPDGAWLAFAGQDFTLRLIPVRDRAVQREHEITIRSSTGPFTCVAFDSSGRFVAAGSERGRVYGWEIGLEGEGTKTPWRVWPVGEIDVSGEAVAGIGFADVGESEPAIVAVDSDGSAVVWRALSAGEVSEGSIVRFRAAESGMGYVSFDPSGRWLGCSSGAAVSLWDLRSLQGQAARVVQASEAVFGVAVDPEGEWCAVGQSDGDIEVVPVKR
ncbi:MAG: serine/threonine-protein kinase [Phycisphaerales bacterium]|nr:serine/threonine-protein kinase [Phycisphaerales bacterium]